MTRIAGSLRSWLLVSVAALGLGIVPSFEGTPRVVSAQETAAPAEPPLVVIAAAGVERLLKDVDYLFDSAKRPEISEVVNGFLGNVNDLKGMDRDKPFGVMLFLAPGLAPRPVPVGFVPVKSIDQLLETVSIGPVRAEKIEGIENRYELVGPDKTFQVRMQHGYAFVGEDEATLDREFPDPVKVTEAQVGRYDISARVDIEAIPSGMKNLFLDFLRASAEGELQRRDDEPEGAYRVRKASGMSNLNVIERVLTQGRDFTLGWDASSERKTAVIEAVLNATPDSAFAKHLQDIAARRSQFSSLLDGSAPLTFSMSWMLDKNGRDVMSEAFKAAELDFDRQLSGEAAAAPAEAGAALAATKPETAVNRLFAPLLTTIENQHLDLFATFQGEPPGGFVLVGGMRVANADSLASALLEVGQKLQQSPNVKMLQLNAARHQGVSLHLFQDNVEATRPEQRIYGGKPGLYIGAGGRTLWFAVGGAEALTGLKAAMDKFAAAPAVSAGERNPDAPFQFLVNASSWLGMMSGPGDGPNPGQELAREAFSGGGDQLRIDFRPTDDGARLRVQFDEAFIRFLGMAAARRYDRSQL